MTIRWAAAPPNLATSPSSRRTLPPTAIVASNSQPNRVPYALLATQSASKRLPPNLRKNLGGDRSWTKWISWRKRSRSSRDRPSGSRLSGPYRLSRMCRIPLRGCLAKSTHWRVSTYCMRRLCFSGRRISCSRTRWRRPGRRWTIRGRRLLRWARLLGNWRRRIRKLGISSWVEGGMEKMQTNLKKGKMLRIQEVTINLWHI